MHDDLEASTSGYRDELAAVHTRNAALEEQVRELLAYKELPLATKKRSALEAERTAFEDGVAQTRRAARARGWICLLVSAAGGTFIAVMRHMYWLSPSMVVMGLIGALVAWYFEPPVRVREREARRSLLSRQILAATREEERAASPRVRVGDAEEIDVNEQDVNATAHAPRLRAG